MKIMLEKIILSIKKKDFLWRNKEFIAGILIIVYVIGINKFPAGYTILGGDVFQYINLKDFFLYYHYEWFSRASLFYCVFYLLDVFGVSSTAQLSWYLGIFLLGSYLSFWFFSRRLFPDYPKILCSAFAVFYATNVYTLFIFSQVWGFTPFMMVYLFIPILTSLYIDILRKSKYVIRDYFLFGLFSFLLSTSFINPAFAVVLAIYFFALTAFLFLLGTEKFKWITLRKITIVLCGVLIMNAYWILPLLPQVSGGIETVSNSQVVDLDIRLQKTSNAIFDTVRLLPTSEQGSYFPRNFPYRSLLWMKDGVVLLSYIPFLLLLCFFFIRTRIQNDSKLYFVFLCTFLVYIALVARVRYPFDWFNSFFFHLPGINTLRGYDKLSIVLPFLTMSLLLITFASLWVKKYGKWLFILVCFLFLALSLPFYLGGIQTKMSYILKNQRSYHTASYSALVRIPKEYFSIQDRINSDSADVKISVLPFSPGSSIGRINLGDWKVNAVHFAPSMYNKRFVELNDYYIPGWMFAQEFENTTTDPTWIVDLYGLLGIKYVLFHKDAKPGSVSDFETNRSMLEAQGALLSIEENNNFILYELPDERVYPYVYITPQGTNLENKVDGIHEKIVESKNGIESLLYTKENMKRVIATVPGDYSGKKIIFNERYDPLWRATYISDKGKRTVLKRDSSIQYANAWKIDKKIKNNGTILIRHASEYWMIPGMLISGIGLVLLIIGYLFLRNKYEY